MFKKGQSGNPGGRVKSDLDIRKMAQNWTAECLQVLADIAMDPKATAASRVTAATALLDRGHGRPHQAIVGADGGALQLNGKFEVVFVQPDNKED